MKISLKNQGGCEGNPLKGGKFEALLNHVLLCFHLQNVDHNIAPSLSKDGMFPSEDRCFNILNHVLSGSYFQESDLVKLSVSQEEISPGQDGGLNI